MATSLDDLFPIGMEIEGPIDPIPERSSVQLRAFVTFDDESVHEVFPQWGIYSADYGSIDQNGLFTAKEVGKGTRTSEVYATWDHAASGSSVSATFTITIRDIDTPPDLISIRIDGPTEVQKNSVEHYDVYARWSDNTETKIVPDSFYSSRPNVAEVDVDGEATFAKIRGNANVSFFAQYVYLSQSFDASIDILVVDQSIYPVKGFIFGPSIISERGRAQFGLDILFENGTNQQVVGSWISTNPKAGTIDCNGNFCANAVEGVERTKIVASYAYEDTTTSASYDLSVIDISVRPESLTIDGPAEVREGVIASYYTTVVFSDGTRVRVNAPITATSQFGVVDAGNQFHAVSQVDQPSPVNLYAEYDGLQAGKTIEVIPSVTKPVRAYIEIKSPMYVGEYQSLKLHVVYEDGLDLIMPAKWDVSNKLIASISDSGVLFAKQVVETAELVVSATTELSGVSLSAQIQVTLIDNQIYPISIEVIGPESVVANQVLNLRAVATFSDGSARDVNPYWICASSLVSVDGGSFKASAPGTYMVNVSYKLQHETVTASKEIIVT